MISYTFGYTLEEEVWKKIIKQKKRKKLEKFSSLFFFLRVYGKVHSFNFFILFQSNFSFMAK